MWYNHINGIKAVIRQQQSDNCIITNTGKNLIPYELLCMLCESQHKSELFQALQVPLWKMLMLWPHGCNENETKRVYFSDICDWACKNRAYLHTKFA